MRVFELWRDVCKKRESSWGLSENTAFFFFSYDMGKNYSSRIEYSKGYSVQLIGKFVSSRKILDLVSQAKAHV